MPEGKQHGEEPSQDSISFFYKDNITFGKYERAGFYKSLLELRKNNSALAANAGYSKVIVGDSNQVFAYTREIDGKKVLIVLNLSAKEAAICLPDPSLVKKPATLISSIYLDPKKYSYQLPAWGYVVSGY